MARQVKFRFDDLILKSVDTNHQHSRRIQPQQEDLEVLSKTKPFKSMSSASSSNLLIHKASTFMPGILPDDPVDFQNKQTVSSTARQNAVSQVYKKNFQTAAECLSKFFARRKNCILSKTFALIKEYSQDQQILLQKFMSHCACMIQKHYRRYIARKYYLRIRPIIARMKELVDCAAQGWKTRKVMGLKSNQKIVQQIKSKFNQGKMRDVRIMRRDFARDLTKQLKTDKWLEEYRLCRKKERPKPQKLLETLKPKEFSVSSKEVVKISFERQKKTQVKNNIHSQKKEQETNLDKAHNMPSNYTNPYDQIPIKPKGNNQLSLDSYADQIFQPQIPKEATPKPKPKVEKKKIIVRANKKQIQAGQQVEKKTTQGIHQDIVVQQQESPLEDKTKKTNAAATFLKKKIRYDPLKSIEEEKRKKSIIKRPIVSNERQDFERPTLENIAIADNTQKPRDKSRSKTPKEAVRDIPTKPKDLVVESVKPKQIGINLVPQQSVKPPNITTPKVSQANHPKSNPCANMASVEHHNNYRETRCELGIDELESTFNSAYSKKKLQLLMKMECLHRVSRRMAYPVTSIRCSSKIYRQYRLANSDIKQNMLEQAFFDLLRR